MVAKVQGSDGLSVSQATTALSLINLLITPLIHLLLAVPDTFASIGCLYRVQDFLRRPNIVGEHSDMYPTEQDVQQINLIYAQKEGNCFNQKQSILRHLLILPKSSFLTILGSGLGEFPRQRISLTC